MRPPISFMLLDVNSGSQNLYKNNKCVDFDWTSFIYKKYTSLQKVEYKKLKCFARKGAS